MTKLETKIDTLAYSWFMPEVFIASAWANEDWFTRLFNVKNHEGSEKIDMFREVIEEVEGYNPLLFDAVVRAFFDRRIPVGSVSELNDLMSGYFPKVVNLKKDVERACPDELITGTAYVGDYKFDSYIRGVLGDLIDRHVQDVNKVLGDHYDGGVWWYSGTTFQLKLSEGVMRCELENIVETGSKFNCNGIKVNMLPVIVE